MSCKCAVHLCPLRPTSNAGDVDDEEGWDNVGESNVLADPQLGLIGSAETDEEVGDDGRSVQIPLGVPEPPQPSRTEVARHNLTHVNYRSWCPHCVAGRRSNNPHRTRLSNHRKVPLLCADYCYLRDVEDEAPLTAMVGRLYPSRAIFATACDAKGTDDPEAVGRLATFLKEAGIPRLVYKTDQESSLKSAIEEALRRVGKSGTYEAFEAIPEYSAVGESASNGKAERAVQAVEDLLRTLKSALEARIHCKLPVDHPVFKWLIEHVASILTRYTINADGRTPYQSLHGNK